MQWLAQICVRRPVFSSVLMLLIVVLGAAGYTKLGLDQYPNVDIPYVVVTTRLDGAAPEEVETDMLITSAPSRLPASSNDVRVRVESSKKRLISVCPRSRSRWVLPERLSST